MNPPITPTLQGEISHFNGIFHEGTVNQYNEGQFDANYVTFTSNIGGKIYRGEVSLSDGSILDGTASGANYNRLGDKISAGTKITLTADDKSHAVALGINRDIDLGGKSKLEVLKKIDIAVADITDELSDVQIYQKRNVANVEESKADSTVLAGIKKGAIHIVGSNFSENGGFESISQFSFNTAENKLSVKIGNLEYSQVLSKRESLGGIGNQYDVAHKIIMGGDKTTLKLTNENSNNFLNINLQGVSDIDISTEKKVHDFVSALNDLFGAEGNSGLSFQVGSNSDDVIVVNFQNIGIDALYKDNQGNLHTQNNILTKGAAAKSLEVIENALDYLTKETTSTSASTNQFMSIQNKLSSVIDSMGEAVSNLVNISLPEAASSYAAESLKLQAATTAHSYHNSVVKDLVTSILRG